MSAADDLVKKANAMFEKGQYDYCISLYRQSILLDLNHVEAHRNLAMSAQKRLQAAGGIGKLKAQMLQAKTSTVLAATKDLTKRIDACLGHLIDDPNNEKIRLDLATALAAAKAVDGAILEAGIAAEINPKSADALKALGVLLGKRGNHDDIMRAQTCLEQASKLNPNDRELGKALRDLAARATMSKSGIDKAKDFRDVIKDKDKAADLERRGQMIKTDDQFTAEVDAVKKEMAENPKDARYPKKIGDLHFDIKKDYETAAQWYQKAVEVNPMDSMLKDKVEDCKTRQLEAQVARLHAAKDPKEKQARIELIKFELACCERRVKDRPTDPNAKFEYGKRLMKAGPNFVDKAAQQFQAAVKDPKLKIDAHVFLGMCFQQKQMYDLADQQYELAEKGGFVAPERQQAIWYQRAKCKYESGAVDGAIELGKRIMAEDIGYKDISELVSKWTKEQKEK